MAPLSTLSTDFPSPLPSRSDEEIEKSPGRIERLKQREAELSCMMASIQREKLAVLRSRPLKIGVVGFGQFGEFIARTFSQRGRVIVTSRSDYTDFSNDMGVKYTSLSYPSSSLDKGLDVVLFGISLLIFEKMIRYFSPHIESYISKSR